MTQKNRISLQSFYIFNSTLCLKEGEEEKKILFYHPFSADIDTKIRSIGLVEAVIKFTETFNSTESCNSVHTQKTRQVYLQVEPNFWMVMIVNVPNVPRTKDGTEYNEYQGDEVQDNVYTAVLKQIYAMFQLLSGTFQALLDSSGVDCLKQCLELFFPKHLLTLKFDHFDVLNIFNGMRYLPLNNITFLNVLCFVNQIQNHFSSSIKATAFMYNDSLIWTGIEPINFQAVYQYMVTILLPAQLEIELKGGSMPRHSGFFSPAQPLHYCRYVIGPQSLNEGSSVGKIPKVYIHSSTTDKLEEYYLVVYRGLSSSVILFLDITTDLTMELFTKLDTFMEPNLTKLGSDIAEYCSTQQIPSLITNVGDSGPRYVFFNNMNLAYKSTIHLDNRQSGNINISQEALKLISDIKSESISHSIFGETVVKTLNDYWVVGKFSNKREFYVAIQHKNANLIEISEEVKKLCDVELKGIFFQT